MSPGKYSHIGIKRNIDKFVSSLQLVPDNIKFDVNIDGFQVFNNAKENCKWEITGLGKEPEEGKVFLIGVYFGENQPKYFHEFLRPFVDEMKKLKVEYCYGGKNIALDVRYVMDAPARAHVTETKNYNAHNRCNRCLIRGQTKNDRTYLYSDNGNIILRTNENFVRGWTLLTITVFALP